MSEEKLPNGQPGNTATLSFIIVICFVSACVLAVISSFLQEAQTRSKEFDRSKQMLIAARILSYEDTFLITEPNGNSISAKYDEATKTLVPGSERASEKQIFAVYQSRIHPMLVNDQGETTTFAQANINEVEYIESNQKKGYANLPWKLIYKILPNLPPNQLEGAKPMGYVIPINGFGLWDAIYGYLAIQADGNTVIGTTWYQQSETAGLGANIALPEWQNLFHDKVIFQESADGQTNFPRAPLGITVVKGKVSEVLGKSPKTKSAVDGITGASLTGKGVTEAYKKTLGPYRAFLIKAHEQGQ